MSFTPIGQERLASFSFFAPRPPPPSRYGIVSKTAPDHVFARPADESVVSISLRLSV